MAVSLKDITAAQEKLLAAKATEDAANIAHNKACSALATAVDGVRDAQAALEKVLAQVVAPGK